MLSPELRGKVDAFLTLHTYSQMWIHPFSHQRKTVPEDINDIECFSSKKCLRSCKILCTKMLRKYFRAVRDAMLSPELRGKVDAFLTLHTYSQMWIHPFSHQRKTVPEDINDIEQVGRRAINALESVYGTKYRFGTGADILSNIFTYAPGIQKRLLRRKITVNPAHFDFLACPLSSSDFFESSLYACFAFSNSRSHVRNVITRTDRRQVPDPSSGGSDDWAKGKGGAKYVYLMELRPSEEVWDGFILDSRQLIPTGRETWAGIKVVIEAVLNLKRGIHLRLKLRLSNFAPALNTRIEVPTTPRPPPPTMATTTPLPPPTWFTTTLPPIWFTTTRPTTWFTTSRPTTWFTTTLPPNWFTTSPPSAFSTARPPTWYTTSQAPVWITTTRPPTWITPPFTPPRVPNAPFTFSPTPPAPTHSTPIPLFAITKAPVRFFALVNGKPMEGNGTHWFWPDTQTTTARHPRPTSTTPAPAPTPPTVAPINFETTTPASATVNAFRRRISRPRVVKPIVVSSEARSIALGRLRQQQAEIDALRQRARAGDQRFLSRQGSISSGHARPMSVLTSTCFDRSPWCAAWIERNPQVCIVSSIFMRRDCLRTCRFC
ncbi:shTK domain protein [Oesophagostomum dentatum]|uniref:ShTK domain protein n=1 Tax=Oesophagostomum dentatum TaxID=61180 RepID=A0A0B1TF37_OESDE|nr:shTK domain protein [Oesophagostomum dentatum]